MTHPRYAVAATCVVVGAMVAVADGQQDAFNCVQFTAVPVAGNVHMVTRPGGGGNVGVFTGPDGVLLVDSLFAPLADRLVAAVGEVSDGNI